ncbi:NAD(P)-binding protein [Ilyonectria sp. MPI-CAGE-AT-0026]|nr:NAD(P)-binding protein [Ilyonectria sp. MPI-CAGE-AT-0026]
MTISTNASAPLIAVVGSTGLQGGSVINNLAASKLPYRVRGLTRDVTKPKAKALENQGVEVFSCNLSADNAAGIQKAFAGAKYVFIMTNFWEHMDEHREAAEGKAMVEAAKNVGVKLLLISSEANATKVSGGKLTKVYHFDSKAFISDHARSLGVPFVDIFAGGYMNNFTTFCRPRPAGDGTYVVDGVWSEETQMPLLDTYHDFGLFVRLAIESGEFNRGDGKVVSAHGEWLNIVQQLDILSQVTGKKIAYNKVTDEQSRAGMVQAGLPPHAIDDMSDMFKFHGIWESVYTHSNRENLARQPRTFKEYCENEDWSQVFA